ncbi:MAG: hypothetical protein WCP69_13020 [Bacteroidota bacterium]
MTWESEKNEFLEPTYRLFADFYQSSTAITQLLVLIIIYFAVSSFIIVIVLFIVRYIRIKQSVAIRTLMINYNEMITKYTFEEFKEVRLFDEVNSNFKRKIFLKSLDQFHSNISGEYSIVLEGIYEFMHLDIIAISYCKSKKWHHQVFGIKVIGNFKDMNNTWHVQNGLKSKSPHVRIQAELSMIKLYPKSPLFFLDDYNFPISDWAQINLFSALEHTPGIFIPDFSQWYMHKVISLSIFSIRMTATFNQAFNIDKLLGLLTNTNEEYRKEVLISLMKFDDNKILEKAKEMFEKETNNNKIILLDILSKYDDLDTFNFLESLISSETNNHILFHTAKALSAYGREGKSKIAVFALNCSNIHLKNGITYLLKNY